MGGFDKPVDETDRHRDEGVLIPRVESDKKGKEEFANLPEAIKKTVNAAILSYLKSLFDSYHLLSPSEEKESHLLEDLKTFKNLLSHLGSKDQSKHPEFAQQLSGLWHKIGQDFNFIKFLEKKNPTIILKLKKIIDEIMQYPPGQEHSFGYYLTEHVGADWLPFPYIEILLLLHKEHQRKPHDSHISNWIHQIDHIIESIEK